MLRKGNQGHIGSMLSRRGIAGFITRFRRPLIFVVIIALCCYLVYAYVFLERLSPLGKEKLSTESEDTHSMGGFAHQPVEHKTHNIPRQLDAMPPREIENLLPKWNEFAHGEHQTRPGGNTEQEVLDRHSRDAQRKFAIDEINRLNIPDTLKSTLLMGHMEAAKLGKQMPPKFGAAPGNRNREHDDFHEEGYEDSDSATDNADNTQFGESGSVTQWKNNSPLRKSGSKGDKLNSLPLRESGSEDVGVATQIIDSERKSANVDSERKSNVDNERKNANVDSTKNVAGDLNRPTTILPAPNSLDDERKATTPPANLQDRTIRSDDNDRHSTVAALLNKGPVPEQFKDQSSPILYDDRIIEEDNDDEARFRDFQQSLNKLKQKKKKKKNRMEEEYDEIEDLDTYAKQKKNKKGNNKNLKKDKRKKNDIEKKKKKKKTGIITKKADKNEKLTTNKPNTEKKISTGLGATKHSPSIDIASNNKIGSDVDDEREKTNDVGNFNNLQGENMKKHGGRQTDTSKDQEIEKIAPSTRSANSNGITTDASKNADDRKRESAELLDFKTSHNEDEKPLSNKRSPSSRSKKSKLTEDQAYANHPFLQQKPNDKKQGLNNNKKNSNLVEQEKTTTTPNKLVNTKEKSEDKEEQSLLRDENRSFEGVTGDKKANEEHKRQDQKITDNFLADKQGNTVVPETVSTRLGEGAKPIVEDAKQGKEHSSLV